MKATGVPKEAATVAPIRRKADLAVEHVGPQLILNELPALAVREPLLQAFLSQSNTETLGAGVTWRWRHLAP